MDRRKILTVVALSMIGVIVLSLTVNASPNSSRKAFRASLTGYEEVPALSTDGFGSLVAQIDEADESMTVELSYGGLSAEAAAAHFHLGQRAVNGGIVVHLCGTGGTDPCPSQPATVSRTIDADDVVAVQGVEEGDFAALLRAMRAGVIYVNVHTSTFPGGEIRGQLG